MVGKKKILPLALSALALASLAGPVAAKSTTMVSQAEAARRLGITVDELRKILGASFKPAASPGASMGSPLAFGAQWGAAYLFVGGQNRGPGTDERVAAKLSGAYGGGFGLGDASRYVALQVDYAVLDASNGPGGASNLNLKLHKAFATQDAAVAIGVENLGRWGDAKDVARAYYVTGTKVYNLTPGDIANPRPVTVTMGWGNGRFRNTERNQKDSFKSSYNLFGSVGYSFHPQVGVIADLSSEVITLGTSFVPMKKVPLSVNVGIYDVTRSTLAKAALTASAAYTFTF